MATDIGPTWSGVEDIRQDLGKVEGNAALGEELARRFSTEVLWYDLEYGEDLRNFINEVDPGPGVIERLVEAQCLLDERVDDAVVEVTRADNGKSLTIEIDVTKGDGTNFTLTLEVSKLTVEILKENTS